MLDLNKAVEEKTSGQWQTPGIVDNVKITEVLIENTTKNNVPYLRLVTEGPNGEVGSSPRMWLNDEAKDGRSTSGAEITARVIVNLIRATYNVSEAEAKAMIPASQIDTMEKIQSKLSAILVGKPFRAKFGGEYTSKGNIFAVLAGSESMRVEKTKMTYNEARDIKPFKGNVVTHTETIDPLA